MYVHNFQECADSCDECVRSVMVLLLSKSEEMDIIWRFYVHVRGIMFLKIHGDWVPIRKFVRSSSCLFLNCSIVWKMILPKVPRLWVTSGSKVESFVNLWWRKQLRLPMLRQCKDEFLTRGPRMSQRRCWRVTGFLFFGNGTVLTGVIPLGQVLHLDIRLMLFKKYQACDSSATSLGHAWSTR